MTDQKPSSLFNTILKAGLVAGTLDITIALVQFYIKTGKSPVIVLQYIASTLFGKEAYTGDVFAAYGLLIHYLIALGWTILFFLLYPKIALLRVNIFLTAIIYGLFVWAMMNRVIVPLFLATKKAFDLKDAAIAFLILVVAIGLPLSFFAKKYYSKK